MGSGFLFATILHKKGLILLRNSPALFPVSCGSVLNLQ
jgi:hypothetical protein